MGCVTVSNPDTESASSSSSSSLASVSPDIRTHTSWYGLTFDYPAGWHILENFHEDFGQFGWAESLFGKIEAAEEFTIHFKVPIVTGPFETFADIYMLDAIFTGSTDDAASHAEKYKTEYGKGEVSSYTSPAGTKFAIYQGMDLNMEGAWTVYITTYTDKERKLHFVEVSRLGSTYEDNALKLKSVIDTLRIILP